MNRNRRTVFFRIMATIMCAACVVVMCSGYQARAETTADFPIAKNGNQLLQAIAAADDGDTIGISDMIAFYEGVTIGAEDKRITIVRMNENAFLSFTGSDSSLVQNVVFDGGNIESNYPMISSQCSLTVENSIFQNCGDPYFSGGIGSIGGAVQLNNGNVIFRECDFAENRAYVGGHVLIGENVIASFFGCTMKNGYAGSGGAISVAANASCFLEECTITKNSSMDYGGGIANGGYTEISKSKVFNNNTINGGADIATKIGGTTVFEDSIEILQELFESENVVVHGWICDYNFDEGIFIPDVEPTAENLLKLDFEYKEQPTTPDETEPTEPENPEGTTAAGNLEGLTLNINVNTASQDQAANTFPIQQSGISWYQAIVLCLLSAILVCLLKRR